MIFLFPAVSFMGILIIIIIILLEELTLFIMTVEYRYKWLNVLHDRFYAFASEAHMEPTIEVLFAFYLFIYFIFFWLLFFQSYELVIHKRYNWSIITPFHAGFNL